MPKLELTLKVDYVPNWDLQAGLREFVSNARDAEVQFSAPMKIDWYNNTLRIENDGCTLPREALLFGHTTKLGMSELIGQFGEGIKLATLVLLRNGYGVKIRSGSEVWEPAIERSEKFNARVLVFHIAEGRKMENRVRVEVSGISKEQWETLKEKFLFLYADSPSKIKTQYGTLLTDPIHSGKIYVKGIFVQNSDNLQFGYDLVTADLDRDRKMVSSYDVRYCTNQIWTEALKRRPDLFENYFSLFDNQKDDISGVDNYHAQYIPKDVLEYVSGKFIERYGKDAVPVGTLEESMDIEHYGKNGIVVTKQLYALLAQTIGDFKAVKEKLKNATKKCYSWSELSDSEKNVLTECTDLLTKVNEDFNISSIDVVEFMSPSLEGLFKDGRVQVRKDFLSNFNKCMQVLVHEFAHALGGADGDKSHVANIENIWMKLFSLVRNKNG